MENHQSDGGRVLLGGEGGDQWLAFGDNDLAECIQLGNWKALVSTLKNDVADQSALAAVRR